MGSGMWFWIIIVVGFVVAVSQFITKFQYFGGVIACLLSIISICAVLFGLVAATIGGSFKLNDNESLLLFLFFMIAVFGFTLGRINKKA